MRGQAWSRSRLYQQPLFIMLTIALRLISVIPGPRHCCSAAWDFCAIMKKPRRDIADLTRVARLSSFAENIKMRADSSPAI